MAYELPQEVLSNLDDELKSVVTKPEVLAIIESVVTPIVTAKSTLLNEKKELQRSIDAFGGIEKVKADLEELGNVRKMTDEERSKAIKASADVEAVRVELSGKLKAEQDTVANLKKSIAERELMNSVAKAVGDSGDFELLLPFINKRISHSLKDDGRLHIDVMTEDGKPMLTSTGDNATLTDLITEFKNSERYGRLFKAEGKGGSGAGHGVASAGAGNNPFKKGPSFNVTEQANLYRNNPVLAKQLAAEAGVALK